MRGTARRGAPGSYPVADAVMRGGILMACHHGLTDDQIDYMHASFQDFADHASRKAG